MEWKNSNDVSVDKLNDNLSDKLKINDGKKTPNILSKRELVYLCKSRKDEETEGAGVGGNDDDSHRSSFSMNDLEEIKLAIFEQKLDVDDVEKLERSYTDQRVNKKKRVSFGTPKVLKF